jgi:hypothetical protein
MDAPTKDDVSITADGRRLDSVEAVIDLVEEAERGRATAERDTEFDSTLATNSIRTRAVAPPERQWRV